MRICDAVPPEKIDFLIPAWRQSKLPEPRIYIDTMSYLYKIFVPLVSSSVTVNQFRTELLIQEYGRLREIEFVSLKRAPRALPCGTPLTELTSAILTVELPSGKHRDTSRADMLHWRIHSGHAVVMKPTIFKDPLLQFWHLRPYMAPSPEFAMEQHMAQLENRLHKLYQLRHRNDMNVVFHQLLHTCVNLSQPIPAAVI